MKECKGNTKGLLRVLLKREFVDICRDVCTYYPLCGREDNYGNIIIETSLRELMQNWLEFIKEETLLQNYARNMGECRDHIIFNQKPKVHPNLSNEVTEYS